MVCQIVWTAFFTFVTMKIIEVCNLIALHKVHTFSLFQVRGLDVPSKYEHIGLDRSEHGEKGCVVLVATPCLNRSVLPSLSSNSQRRALHASVDTCTHPLCTTQHVCSNTTLENRYDLDFHNEEDETVMVAELCSVAALGDVKYLAKLIRLGADPNATDVDNRTPLHLAARNGHIDTMRYLIKQCNVHLNVKDNFGGSPLSDAKKGGSEEAVLFLKDLGAIKVPTEHDEDELRLRAHANEVDQVMALLAGGVDVNSADYDDRTALHIAASEGHEEVVAALLKARADPLVTDRFGMMPIQDAQRYKHEGMERLIRSGTDVDFDRMTTSTISKSTSIDFDGGASTRELLHAAHTGDLAEIKRLKLKRANLLGCDYDGRTALHLAASSGHMHIVKYMVELIPGTNVNQQDRAKNSAYVAPLFPLVFAPNPSITCLGTHSSR